MNSVQRKLVVMFADVPGSATLFERLRDSEALHAVERCMKRTTRSIESYGGRIVQIGGDELQALFDSAEEACHAAIDMQQRIADLPPVSGYKLGIRIGLHCGEVAEDPAGGEAARTAARICGTARRDQILCCAAVIAALPTPNAISADRAPNPDSLADDGIALVLHQIFWPAPALIAAGEPPAAPAQEAVPAASKSFERLCVRYRGKALLLDGDTPLLTIGRDLGNQLVIEDAKVSRQHARIEKRSDGYYLVDTSTNGTFVTLTGERESMLRRNELPLSSNGRIAFGTSTNDAKAEIAEFEYL